MAAVTHADAAATTTGAASYASAAFTPASNDLLIAFIHVTATSPIVPASCTMSDSQSLGWTLVDSAERGGSANNHLLVYVANALASASSMTVTFTPNVSGNGCIVIVERVSGMSKTGATAIKQSVSVDSTAAATTPAATFAASALTGNPTFAYLGNGTNPAGLTQPTGWTERADVGYNTPNSGSEVASRDSGFTGTTITWGSNSASNWGAIIVELDASAAGGGFAGAARIIGSGGWSAPLTGTVVH